MANKTCVVNRDQDGQVSTVLVKKPEVKAVSVNIVDFAIGRNNGLDLSLAPNGKPSILYQSYVDTMGMSDLEAKEQVAKVYTDDFGNKFGRFYENFEKIENNFQDMINKLGIEEYDCE